jgi:1-deoxy-D-xylulose-5-phosphate reductoisomerase
MTYSSLATDIRCCPQTGRRRVAILGATGSIGTSALDVIRALPSKLQTFGISAHRSFGSLYRIVREHKPRMVALSGPQLEPNVEADHKEDPWFGATILRGTNSLEELVRHPDVDIVLSAVVGTAGLASSWAALEEGKALALANKETLVAAGPLVMQLAKRKRCPLLPVDSEHSAIFQIIAEKGVDQVERIVLTGSGGPFRGRTRRELENVSIDQALQHPTWKMGPKITIDSATMMNKALEIVEARWLFGLAPDQIQVVIHPESVVHSFVEFKDGSVMAQLSPPDMRLPIQYALTYPERLSGPARRLDWSNLKALTFDLPDRASFPALDLGFAVAQRGGTAGAALNAANEAAVGRFLAGAMRFIDITPACQEVVSGHPYKAEPNLDDLMTIDRWARQEIEHWKSLA